MKKKNLKRIMSFVLTLSIAPISSFPVLAAPSNNIDFDMLAKSMSQPYYSHLEMDKLGLDLNEILQLSERDSFFEEVEDLLSDLNLSSLGIITRATASIEPAKTLEAKRLEYAGRMPTWSVSKKSNLNTYKDVLYMYLNHYVDVRQPLHSLNSISSNSEGPVYANYYISLTTIQLDLVYALLDKANFLVVQSTYNFRLYDRLKYFYMGY